MPPLKADTGGGHAEKRGVAYNTRVLEVFVDNIEVPLEGADAETIGGGAVGAYGGAPNRV